MMKLGGEEEGEEAYYCNLNAMFRLHYTPLQWMNKVAWNLNSSLLSLGTGCHVATHCCRSGSKFDLGFQPKFE